MNKVEYPERILIVLNEDGSFKGAHQERLQTVFDDDGSLLVAKQLPAEPLDAKALKKVLPNEAALAAQVAADAKALKAAADTVISLQERVAYLTDRVNDTANELSVIKQANAALVGNTIKEIPVS